MRNDRWTDQLSSATKTTIVICGVLLVISAIITLFLMFFPIKKEDQPTVVVQPVRHTEYAATTAITTQPETTTSHGPHTLSTWNAGINGFWRSLDEFKTTASTLATTTATSPLWRETTDTSSTSTEMSGVSDIVVISTNATDMPQTVTTTVDETEMTAPSMPPADDPGGNE